MFREFLFDKNNIEGTIIERIAKEINQFYKNDNVVVHNSTKCYFDVHFDKDIIYHFVYTFSIDKMSNIFRHHYFIELKSDDIVYKIKTLGLDKFIIA